MLVDRIDVNDVERRKNWKLLRQRSKCPKFSFCLVKGDLVVLAQLRIFAKKHLLR